MYKLLPILLFAFLVAEENNKPQIIQSDSLDFIYWQSFLDDGLIKMKAEIANFIDKDKFVINIESKVYDVMR